MDNLSMVTFNTLTGFEQCEIVKHISCDDLNSWINQYKHSYCPNANHSITTINAIKSSKNVNVTNELHQLT